MEERERLEARRCGISVSRGEEEDEVVAPAVGSLGPGEGEGGWREEVEEAMVWKTRLAAANALRVLVGSGGICMLIHAPVLRKIRLLKLAS